MNRFTFALTPEQAAQFASQLKPGFTLLARITHETFDGANVETSGRPIVEFGSVPTASLPALRDAIRKATQPKKAGRKAKA